MVLTEPSVMSLQAEARARGVDVLEEAVGRAAGLVGVELQGRAHRGEVVVAGGMDASQAVPLVIVVVRDVRRAEERC